MKEIFLEPLVDENGDSFEDTLCYEIEMTSAGKPFVPAKVLQDCVDGGYPYLLLMIPNSDFNVFIEVGKLTESKAVVV